MFPVATVVVYLGLATARGNVLAFISGTWCQGYICALVSRAREQLFSNSVNDGFSNSVKYDFLKIVLRARERARVNVSIFKYFQVQKQKF